jgi:hypothetical protein
MQTTARFDAGYSLRDCEVVDDLLRFIASCGAALGSSGTILA